jgi:plasmid stability protein
MSKRKVAQLIVRNIDDDLVKLLRLRAAQNRRSAEAEHREILRQALRGGADAATFDAFLLEIPNVGDDRDFERVRDKGRKVAL